MDEPQITASAQPSTTDLDIDRMIVCEDAVKAAAEKQDVQAFVALQQQFDMPYILDALDQAEIGLCQDIFKTCESIISEEPTTDPPNRLLEIMDQLFYPPTEASHDLLRKKVQPLVRQVRWIREQRVDLDVPNLLEHLKHLSEKFFPLTMTYEQVHERELLADELLGSIINIDLPNKQFSEDVQFVLNATQETGEFNEEFLLRISTLLYYYQMIGDLIITAQELQNEADDAKIDFKIAFEIAPTVIKPLAYARDEQIKTLLFPDDLGPTIGPDQPQTKSNTETPAVNTEQETEQPTEIDVA